MTAENIHFYILWFQWSTNALTRMAMGVATGLLRTSVTCTSTCPTSAPICVDSARGVVEAGMEAIMAATVAGMMLVGVSLPELHISCLVSHIIGSSSCRTDEIHVLYPDAGRKMDVS